MAVQQIRGFDGAWRDGREPPLHIDYKMWHTRGESKIPKHLVVSSVNTRPYGEGHSAAQVRAPS